MKVSSNPQASNSLQEEPYNEEEDEDFDPTKDNTDISDEGDDDEDGFSIAGGESRRRNNNVDYSQIESESGGLIKTRRGRLLQEERDKRNRYETMEEKTIPDSIKDIWKDLQILSNKRLGTQGSSGSVLADDITASQVGSRSHMGEEMILIKRDYVFAGELIHEEKNVPISSAEAQEYINSTKFVSIKKNGKDSKTREKGAQNGGKTTSNKFSKFSISNEQKFKLRRPLKRPPILEQIISGSLKPKLTTLEKSSLDWATYVDKEGINDELTLHNKDGYLAKQDFLNKVEHFKDNQYKELRQKQLAMQAQQNG